MTDKSGKYHLYRFILVEFTGGVTDKPGVSVRSGGFCVTDNSLGSGSALPKEIYGWRKNSDV